MLQWKLELIPLPFGKSLISLGFLKSPHLWQLDPPPHSKLPFSSSASIQVFNFDLTSLSQTVLRLWKPE